MAFPRLPIAINTLQESGAPEAIVYYEVDREFWAPPEWLKLGQGVLHRWCLRASRSQGRRLSLGGVLYRVDGKLIYPVKQDPQCIVLESEWWDLVFDR